MFTVIYLVIVEFIVNKIINYNNIVSFDNFSGSLCCYYSCFINNIVVSLAFTSIITFFIVNYYAGIILAIITALLFIGFIIYYSNNFLFKKASQSIFKAKLILFIIFTLSTVLNPSLLSGIIPLREAFVDVQYINNNDMTPTFNPGSLLLVDKMSGLIKKQGHKDIVIIKYPYKPNNGCIFANALKGKKILSLEESLALKEIKLHSHLKINLNRNSKEIIHMC